MVTFNCLVQRTRNIFSKLPPAQLSLGIDTCQVFETTNYVPVHFVSRPLQAGYYKFLLKALRYWANGLFYERVSKCPPSIA